MNLDNSKSIRLKIMDYLARREHSTIEIFQKLKHRVESLDLLKKEIEQLKQEGLINHQRFAEQYIHSRSIKGYGPLRIKQELKNKGIDSDVSGPLIDEIDWSVLAHEVFQKKTKGNFPEDTNELLKVKRFLNYRGFEFYDIDKVTSLKGKSKE